MAGRGGSVTALAKQRGKSCELKLVRLLNAKGYRALRIPTSARTTAPLPDVLATHKRKNLLVAFEVKGTHHRSVEVSVRQLRKLKHFIEGFPSSIRAEAVVAVWFYEPREWVFKRVEDARRPLSVSMDDDSTWSP